MVFPAKSVWFGTICVFVVPCLTFGRPSLIPSLNSRRPSLNLVDYGSSENSYTSKSVEELSSERPSTKECNCKCEKVPDDSLNDIQQFIPSSTPEPKTAKLRQQLPIQNIPAYQLMPTSCLLHSRKRSTRLSRDIHPVGDIKFEIDTRRTYGNMKTTVIAECDFLVGLEDFQMVKLNANLPNDYILKWRKLKTRCPVSIVTGEIQEGRGEAAIQVERLFMQVKMSPTHLRKNELGLVSIETQMSEVKNAIVDIQDLGGFPTDYTRVISSEIEKTILCIVNSEVRNVLQDSLKCFWDGSSTSCKLTS